MDKFCLPKEVYMYKKIQILRVIALDNSINDGQYFNVYVIAKNILKAQKIIIKKFKKAGVPVSISESTSKVVVNNNLDDIVDCCYSYSYEANK